MISCQLITLFEVGRRAESPPGDVSQALVQFVGGHCEGKLPRMMQCPSDSMPLMRIGKTQGKRSVYNNQVLGVCNVKWCLHIRLALCRTRTVQCPLFLWPRLKLGKFELRDIGRTTIDSNWSSLIDGLEKAKAFGGGGEGA